MPSDFSTACKTARAAIAVPALPLLEIRSAAALAARPQKRNWLLASLFAAVPVVAIAAAAVIATTHIQFTKGGGIVLQGSPVSKWHATQADAELAARADAVMLPAGLPAGSQITAVMNWGSDTLALSYNLPGAWRRSNHVLWVIVTRAQDTTTPHAGSASVIYATSKGRRSIGWIAGNERIYLDAPVTLTREELSAMKAAMGATDIR